MADRELLRYVARKTGLGLHYLSKDEKISILLEQVREIFPAGPQSFIAPFFHATSFCL